jgi:hypothetical protein
MSLLYLLRTISRGRSSRNQLELRLGTGDLTSFQRLTAQYLWCPKADRSLLIYILHRVQSFSRIYNTRALGKRYFARLVCCSLLRAGGRKIVTRSLLISWPYRDYKNNMNFEALQKCNLRVKRQVIIKPAALQRQRMMSILVNGGLKPVWNCDNANDYK